MLPPPPICFSRKIPLVLSPRTAASCAKRPPRCSAPALGAGLVQPPSLALGLCTLRPAGPGAAPSLGAAQPSPAQCWLPLRPRDTAVKAALRWLGRHGPALRGPGRTPQVAGPGLGSCFTPHQVLLGRGEPWGCAGVHRAGVRPAGSVCWGHSAAGAPGSLGTLALGSRPRQCGRGWGQPAGLGKGHRANPCKVRPGSIRAAEQLAPYQEKVNN